jgi:hypothetical protein
MFVILVLFQLISLLLGHNSRYWLGEAGNGSHRAMNSDLRSWEGSEVDLFDLINATQHLCKRQYWKRFWIVQEVMLANHIVVLRSDSCTWQTFLSMVPATDAEVHLRWAGEVGEYVTSSPGSYQSGGCILQEEPKLPMRIVFARKKRIEGPAVLIRENCR